MYVFLLLLWLIFCGRITAEIIVFGIFISAGVYAFACRFMNYSPRTDLFLIKEAGYIVRYIVTLLIEIFKASVGAIAIIIGLKGTPEPVIVKFHSNLSTDVARVLLANSITLTPGTITVSLDGDLFTVHCLDKSLAEGLESSVFAKQLKTMEEAGRK